ncbi:MAG: putative metal-binding motif-containing protein, partial [Nanoarchaeota archaeon]|nr:putative metal-binding motif-containing protein [Nanoarchaeota archaeon]
TNAAINPGAIELCNGIDDNCNGAADEGVKTTFYADADFDSFGNAAVSTDACAAPEGFVADSTDCDDAVASCNSDCTGVAFADADGDLFGSQDVSARACDAPEGYVLDSTDCDDTNAAINPGAIELCNGIDDNCNGTADEDLTRADENVLGLCSRNTEVCSVGEWLDSETNYISVNETCDGLDNNCDGTVDEGDFSDADADGIKDCVDTDNDNDGVADSEDVIWGNSSDINTNVPGGLVFSVDDVQDAANHAGIGRVKLANGSGLVLVEFDYDFSNALDLGSINLTVGNNSGFGSVIIKGINLSGQNATKTAYIDKKAGTNTLCIIDDEVDSIVVEGDCSNGIKVLCPGTNGDYSCELADGGARYKVSGLKHSAVTEYSYTAPVVEPVKIEPVVLLGGRKKAPVVEKVPVVEEPVVEEEQPVAEEPVAEEEQPVVEEPTRVEKALARLGQITGRVVTSVRNSPGAWGGGIGLAIAISLIASIYITTRKATKL